MKSFCHEEPASTKISRANNCHKKCSRTIVVRDALRPSRCSYFPEAISPKRNKCMILFPSWRFREVMQTANFPPLRSGSLLARMPRSSLWIARILGRGPASQISFSLSPSYMYPPAHAPLSRFCEFALANFSPKC